MSYNIFAPSPIIVCHLLGVHTISPTKEHLSVILVKSCKECRFVRSLESQKEDEEVRTLGGTWVQTARRVGMVDWLTMIPSSTRREASQGLKPVCVTLVYTTLHRPWSHASTKPPPSPVQELYCFLTRVFVSDTWHCTIKRQREFQDKVDYASVTRESLYQNTTSYVLLCVCLHETTRCWLADSCKIWHSISMKFVLSHTDQSNITNKIKHISQLLTHLL